MNLVRLASLRLSPFAKFASPEDKLLNPEGRPTAQHMVNTGVNRYSNSDNSGDFQANPKSALFFPP
jgi:hypothetical protein